MFLCGQQQIKRNFLEIDVAKNLMSLLKKNGAAKKIKKFFNETSFAEGFLKTIFPFSVREKTTKHTFFHHTKKK